LHTRKKVAVKKVKTEQHREGLHRSTTRELKLLRILHHRNVIAQGSGEEPG